MSGHDEAPDIEERPDTSFVSLQALAGDTVYCNVAGSGPTFPVAQRAAESARRWLSEVGMFGHAGYDAYNGWLAAARTDIAHFLGDPDGASRVALATSATEGLNALISGLKLTKGATIITTAEEHGSALMPLHHRREKGDRLRILRHEDDASFLASVAEALRDGASALVMSLVSCKTGKLLPAREACALARTAGAVTIVDAAQGLGQVAVDVRALGADAVVTLGHKWMHGPLATGAFWVADVERFSVERVGWRSQSSFHVDDGYVLNPDATRFETGTIDAPAFVGLRQSIAVHRALGPVVGVRIRALRARLLERIAELPLRLRSRPGDPTGIVVVEPRGGDAAGIVTRMWRDDRVVVKHLREPGMIEDGIRISFWALHTEADLELLTAAFAKQLKVAA